MNDPQGYEQTIRDMIRHENELMNHRITWLMTLEGLLFTALGFAWGKPDTRGLIFILCALGALVPASSWWILEAAQRALKRLQAWWETNKPKDYAGPGVVGDWHPKPITRWIIPWRAFPILFFSAWIAIAMIAIAHPPPVAIQAPDHPTQTPEAHLTARAIAIPSPSPMLTPP